MQTVRISSGQISQIILWIPIPNFGTVNKRIAQMRSDMKCCFANTRPAGIAINDVIPMHFEQSTNVHIIDLNVLMGHKILSVKYSHFVKFFTWFAWRQKMHFILTTRHILFGSLRIPTVILSNGVYRFFIGQLSHMVVYCIRSTCHRSRMQSQ